jgi:adenylosuccinate lyase
MFLSADVTLMMLDNVASNLVVYPACIHSRIMEELPFMVTETIIMKLVEIRVLSHQASDVVKKEGGKNDLIERIKRTDFLAPVKDQIDDMLDLKNFIGRCPEQVMTFCGPDGEVQMALEPYRAQVNGSRTV